MPLKNYAQATAVMRSSSAICSGRASDGGKSSEIAVIRFISRVYPIPIRLMIPRHISLLRARDPRPFLTAIFARAGGREGGRRAPLHVARCTSLDWIQFAESFVGFSIRVALECA